LAKRKTKKQRQSLFGRLSKWRHQAAVNLEETFEQADRLIDRGRAREAVALLEPLVASHSRVAELHYYLGYARVKAGDIWTGLTGYEQAMELSREPSYWTPLASLYLQAGLNVHALQAFRQVLKYGLEGPIERERVREGVASLERDIAETAHQLDISADQMEKSLRYLEEGQRALHRGDYRACIAVNQKAIKIVGDWPPPHNNLSQALFFDGQPEAAIATARHVLSIEPDNLQALSNAIRFLAWTGRESEAQALWARLRHITPREHTERLKKAEAAAILGEDESVYQLLKPLDKAGPILFGMPGHSWQTKLLLAVAEANLGQRNAAQRRLKELQPELPWAGELLTALRARQPGPGWAPRFPYFHSTELIARPAIDEFMELVERQGKVSSKKYESQMSQFVVRFPQIVLMAEKLIIEEQQPKAGIVMLATIATPVAYAALRRFGLSQMGDDDTRMQALFKLLEADQIDQHETLRVWSGGQWQELQLRRYDISDEAEVAYAPKVAELLNQGLRMFQQNKVEQAERLFQQALELEPRAKEAYNNLATIYARREEHDRARTMFQAAIEIDPTYVFPRANLALYLLSEDDIEGAEAMLAPLANETRFQPQEMAFYAYIQARLLMRKEEYEKARNQLKMALDIIPDYELAQNLLDDLERITLLEKGWQSFMERQRRQNQLNRARLQKKLDTTEPALAEALALYSKDVLTAMAREVIPWGGWSALRKVELLQRIHDLLVDQDNLERVIAELKNEECEALRQVLTGGGRMAWQKFDTGYGNDLEESPHWQYHVPKTVMGRLRLRGLLVEATVNDELLIVVPAELRRPLSELLA
jgi:Flp pilus assembly protein TadD